MEDRKIWTKIKNGDKKALKELHNKYFYQLCLYAVKSTEGNTGLAQELVSDCFIKIWENRKKLEINSSVKHYLFVILRNNIIDHYRKKRILTEPLNGDFSEPGDEKIFDDQKQYAVLYEALKKLPEQRRKILELAVFDSLTYQEIAIKLNISKNTVKTQIARAYRLLKESLDPKDFIFFIIVTSPLKSAGDLPKNPKN